MSKPVAVLISDIHFTVGTLELASASLRKAIDEASRLSIPVVLCGDTLDGKALVRAEAANRLIEILSEPGPRKVVLVGNHDLINEKGKAHSLNFLRPYCDIVEHPVYDRQLKSHLIPYQTSPGELQCILADIDPGSRIICHQGVHGADMGHYVKDATSLSTEHFADFRTISGHYHRRQDIKAGRPRKGDVGLFSYIGNPYSLSFGEANDGPKGFQVLMSDGLLEFVRTNLRKHVVCELTAEQVLHELETESGSLTTTPGDLLWLKVRGPHDTLAKLKKTDISKAIGHSNFKLDRIYTDQPALEPSAKPLTDTQMLDAVIDSGDDTAEAKTELKALAREVLA